MQKCYKDYKVDHSKAEAEDRNSENNNDWGYKISSFRNIGWLTRMDKLLKFPKLITQRQNLRREIVRITMSGVQSHC